MEFVYCPNGHQNRPGTRICAFCRALIDQRAPQSAAAPPPPRKPAAPRPAEPLAPTPRPAADRPTETRPAEYIPDPTPVEAPPGKKRNWLWLLLLLLLGFLVFLALAVLAFLYPTSRADEVQPTAVMATTAAVIVVNTPEPVSTDPPLPTATAENLVVPTDIAAEPSPTTVSTITPLSTIVGVVITPTFSFGPDTNLLQNGDFASDWANGWSSSMDGEWGEVEVRPVDDEPGVNALHLGQDGPGYMQIAQRVVLTYPIEGLEFQARVRAAGTASGVAEGRSALILLYEDFNGEPIGASLWLDGAAASTDLLDSLLSLSDVPVAEHSLAEGWQTLSVDLGREFTEELAGISPIDVAQLTIIMAAINSDACVPGSCAVVFEATDLSLAPNLP